MSRSLFPAGLGVVLIVLGLAMQPASAAAATTCVFLNAGDVTQLQGDCTTDSTIFVPEGTTLDGRGFTITAVDPPGDHFRGAIVKNQGTWAAVVNLTVTTLNLANVCDASTPVDNRLRGIMLEGASGLIENNTVTNLNQGPSGCQEGNAIEARNAPFDGTHPATTHVEVAHNDVIAWQKTGIVINGDVEAVVHHNKVSVSATQAYLAANSIQIGFGAKGDVEDNHIAGNSWPGPSDYVGTAVLLYQAEAGTVVRHNNLMEGNADVGIYIFADGVTVDNNRIFETGPDLNQFGYDIGLGNYGDGNITSVTLNKVRGYQTPYDGDVGQRNFVIPSPHSD